MGFVMNLTYDRNTPVFRRVASALGDAIKEGRLLPGESVPSVRELASSLKISRATVLKALEELKAEGLLESIIGAGTFVKGYASTAIKAGDDAEEEAGKATKLSRGHFARRDFASSGEGKSQYALQRTVRWTAYAERIIDLANREGAADFHFSTIEHGALPLSLLPTAAWNALLMDSCRQQAAMDTDQAHRHGYLPLLVALSGYLQRARRIRCQPSQVMLCSTKGLRLELVSRILIDPGDVVVMEEPGFPEARMTFESHDACVIHIPVDKDGMDIDKLKSLKIPVKFVYLTPAHQDPTGAVLSDERRRKLIDWARRSKTYIIEDDYDGEFRYGNRPSPSLQSWGSDCVIYIGSLWKALFPIVRTGFIVVPEHMAEIFSRAQELMQHQEGTIEQSALAVFINRGHLERHILKANKVLGRRRQALIFALTVYMRHRFKLNAETAGTHIVGCLDTSLSDAHVASLAEASGLSVMSTESYYALAPKKGELMIPFSHIESEAVNASVRRWLSSIEEAERS